MSRTAVTATMRAIGVIGRCASLTVWSRAELGVLVLRPAQMMGVWTEIFKEESGKSWLTVSDDPVEASN